MGYWDFIELDWELVDLSDEERFLASYEATAEPVRHLIAAHWLHSEVFNGGFHQFFGNHSGVLAPEAVSGLRAIGLDELANIAAGAIAFFPSPYPRDRQTRIALIEAHSDPEAEDREGSDPFYELDDLFYSAIGPRLAENRFFAAADAYAERFNGA